MGNSTQTSLKAATAMVLAGGALWGIISLFVRVLGAAGLSSQQISLVRLAVGALGMAVVILVRDPSKFRFRLRDVWMFIGTGIVSVTLFNICYFMCIQLSEASVAVVLLYTSPAWLIVMGAVFFHERITGLKAGSIVLTICGSVLVAGVVGTGFSMSPFALFIGLCSGFFYALYSVFGRVASARYDTLTITFWTFFFGAAASAVVGDAPGVVACVAADPSVAVWMLGIGIVCTLVPYLLYTAGLARMDVGRAAVLAMSEPLVACVLGIFAYGDTVTAPKLAGMALILISIVMSSKMRQN